MRSRRPGLWPCRHCDRTPRGQRCNRSRTPPRTPRDRQIPATRRLYTRDTARRTSDAREAHHGTRSATSIACLHHECNRLFTILSSRRGLGLVTAPHVQIEIDGRKRNILPLALLCTRSRVCTVRYTAAVLCLCLRPLNSSTPPRSSVVAGLCQCTAHDTPRVTPVSQKHPPRRPTARRPRVQNPLFSL